MSTLLKEPLKQNQFRISIFTQDRGPRPVNLPPFFFQICPVSVFILFTFLTARTTRAEIYTSSPQCQERLSWSFSNITLFSCLRLGILMGCWSQWKLPDSHQNELNFVLLAVPLWHSTPESVLFYVISGVTCTLRCGEMVKNEQNIVWKSPGPLFFYPYKPWGFAIVRLLLCQQISFLTTWTETRHEKDFVLPEELCLLWWVSFTNKCSGVVALIRSQFPCACLQVGAVCKSSWKKCHRKVQVTHFSSVQYDQESTCPADLFTAFFVPGQGRERQQKCRREKKHKRKQEFILKQNNDGLIPATHLEDCFAVHVSDGRNQRRTQCLSFVPFFVSSEVLGTPSLCHFGQEQKFLYLGHKLSTMRRHPLLSQTVPDPQLTLTQVNVCRFT